MRRKKGKRAEGERERRERGKRKKKKRRNAAETPSVGEKKRIGNYPWIVRKCSKGSTGRTSEPSGKWTMEIVGEAAMARRLYKGPQSKISRSLCFFHDRASLFQSEKKYIYIYTRHLDQIFPVFASPSPLSTPCLRQPFEINFLPAINVIRYNVTDRSWLRSETEVTPMDSFRLELDYYSSKIHV